MAKEEGVGAGSGTPAESGPLPWALIGAGPTGLAAARNLARRGIPHAAGAAIGGLDDAGKAGNDDD